MIIRLGGGRFRADWLLAIVFACSELGCGNESSDGSGGGGTENAGSGGIGARGGGSGAGGAASAPNGPPALPTCLDNCSQKEANPACSSGLGLACETLCESRLLDSLEVCNGAAGNFFACLLTSVDECAVDDATDCRSVEDVWQRCEAVNNPYGCGTGATEAYGMGSSDRISCGVISPCYGRTLAIDCVAEQSFNTCQCTINGTVAGSCENDSPPECRGVLDGCCRQSYFGL